MLKCSICGKEYKTQQGLNSHIGWHNKPNRKSNLIDYNKQIKSGERKCSNQYIKAKQEGKLYIMSDETKKKISKRFKGKKLSQEHKDNISNAMRKAVLENPDSYSASNVSGRVKTFEYNGSKLKGTWELLVAQWLDEMGIKWTNIIDGIDYEWNGKTHLYFPDFYLPELDKYIEVKGYERDRDLEKWKVLDNLIILKKKEIDLIKNKKYDSLL